MKRIGSILLVLALLGVGLGFYRGWFAASERREILTDKVDIQLSVDTDKMKKDADYVVHGKPKDLKGTLKEDAEIVKEKATELGGKIKDEAQELGRDIRDTFQQKK